MVMASSSSSFVSRQLEYEVFLSFRGKDTRNNFTSHLHAALCRKKIKTFKDDQIDRGDDISSSLLNNIKASKISVIIFSQNYADSSWCLRELEEILLCKRTRGQIAIPVFYHVDPSDIRNVSKRRQTSAFGKAFKKLQKRFKERSEDLKGWESALEEAANLSGCLINDEMPENVLIEKIVGEILRRLNKLCPSDNKDLVGIKFSQQKIESLLCKESKGVRIVGIWGMGGIGKTTISHAVFNKISSQFESSYFAKDVRQVSERRSEMSSLKERLLSALLEERYVSIDRDYTIERLRCKKVLIVFDDVSDPRQIHDLVQDLSLLNSRSLVIITSRDIQILNTCGVESGNIYEVRGLCDHDALQLFSKCAFKQNHPPEDFMELSKKIVTYSKGIPLALKVLGSCLFDKTKQVWESKMDKLEKIPHEDIQKILKLSYDGLDFEERRIFLDIACFFRGWRRCLVQDILNANGFFTCTGIDRLVDKSLITISHKETLTLFDQITSDEETITMHDLLQEMGKEIVRQESIDPGRRSRLWHYEDICNVLRRNTGTEAIEGISLDIGEIRSSITLNRHAFKKLHNLRFFHVYNSKVTYPKNYLYYHSSSNQDYEQKKLHGLEELEEYLSTKVFMWIGCPLKSLQLDAENLVRLEMRYSQVEELWNGIQNLVNLKHIDLGQSIYLTCIPNLSKALNLQELILDGCGSLSDINSSSIENLDKLEKVDVSSCRKLISFPDFVQSKSIILCGCSELKMAPNISCKVEKLDLSWTTIKELPFIEDKSRLVHLSLHDCSQLESLSSDIFKCKRLQYLSLNHYSLLGRVLDDFGNLEALEEIEIFRTPIYFLRAEGRDLLSPNARGDQVSLYWVFNAFSALRSLKRQVISYCGVRELPDNLGQLSFLQELDLSDNGFESIPSSIKDFPNLRSLDIRSCRRLKSLPELPRGINLDASNCSSLEFISDLSFLFSSGSRPRMINFACCSKLNLSMDILHKETLSKICDCICYPGDKVPKWFSMKSRGSYITLKEPPDWKTENFIGLNICVVIAELSCCPTSSALLTCNLYIKTEDDMIEQYKISPPRNHYDRQLYAESFHVLLGFTESIGHEPVNVLGRQDEGYKDVMKKMRNDKALIQFNNLYNFDKSVRECGVHFHCTQDCEGSGSRCLILDEEEERVEPHPKSPKPSNFVEGEPSSRGLIPDEEEERDLGGIHLIQLLGIVIVIVMVAMLL